MIHQNISTGFKILAVNIDIYQVSNTLNVTLLQEFALLGGEDFLAHERVHRKALLDAKLVWRESTSVGLLAALDGVFIHVVNG